MNMDFNTPRQERGAGTPGTFVAGGSATPMRGSPPPQEPLCGTEARKAKQAQRREAKLAQRTLLRAAAADTPAAFNPAVGTPAPVVPAAIDTADAEEAQPPSEPAAEFQNVHAMPAQNDDDAQEDGNPGLILEIKSQSVPEMPEIDAVVDFIDQVMPSGVVKEVLEDSNFEEVVSQYIDTEAPLLPK